MITTKIKNILLLIVRLIIAVIFIYAGWAKVSAMAQTIGFFSKIGIPAFLAYITGYTEFIGGILLALGLWSEWVATVLAIIMGFAVYFTYGGGFQSFSMPLVTLAGLLSIIASGSGAYAIKLKRKIETINS